MTAIKKIYLSLIIFTFLAGALISFLIFPLWQEIKKSSQGLISQRQDLLLLSSKVENLEKFKILYQGLKPDLERIDTLFVNPELPIEFISFLEKNSREVGVLIKISPTLLKETKKEPWSFLIFQINLTGLFPNVLKFLEKLETAPYLVEIQNLNVSSSKELEKLPSAETKTALTIKVFTK